MRKFNTPAFAFATVMVAAQLAVPVLGTTLALITQALALIGLLTVAYYQTRRLD